MTRTFRAAVLAAATVTAGAGFSAPAAACGDESYLGSVCTFGFGFCPRGWAETNGQLLPIPSYAALYSLLGVAFGGDGVSNFALPDLRARGMVATGASPALGTVVRGQNIGDLNVTLLVPLPAHTHQASFVPSGGSGGTISGSVDIPLDGTVSGLPFSASANLNVTADAKIGTTNTTGRTQNVGDNVLLTSGSSPAPNIYAPAGNGNTTVIGPAGAVTGSATGTVSGTASGGVLLGSAKGDVTLNVTGGSGGGTVVVGSSGIAGAAMTIPTRSPSMGMTTCIRIDGGVYPPRG